MASNDVLAAVRAESRLTQVDFANRMGWTQGFVSQLETGARLIHSHALLVADEFRSEMRRLNYNVEDLLRGSKVSRRRSNRAS